MSLGQISAALKRARRRDIPAKAAAIQAALRAAHLGQPAEVTAAYASSVQALVAVLGTLNAQVNAMDGQVEAVLATTRTLRSSCPSRGWV